MPRPLVGTSPRSPHSRGCPSITSQTTRLSCPAGSGQASAATPHCHLSVPGRSGASLVRSPIARPGHWKMNYVSFISKKQSRSPFVIKFAVRETLLYLITSDISWLLVLETIKV